METENNQKDILGPVLQKIQEGKVRMKPKAYFVFKIIALIVVAVLALIMSSVLLSYIFFNLVESGRLFLLGFGLRGLSQFFLLFPWFIFLFDIVLLVIFDWLLKKFSFGYRAPLGYLFLGTAGAALVLGVLVNITPLHPQLLYLAEVNRGLPTPILDFYNQLRRPSRDTGVYRGTVVSVGHDSFWLLFDDLENSQDPGLTLVTYPASSSSQYKVEAGEHVFVAGEMASGTINAYGVTDLPEEN